jgi:hypothetical protein
VASVAPSPSESLDSLALPSSLSDEITVADFVSKKDVQGKDYHMRNNKIIYINIYIYIYISTIKIA